MKKTNKEPLKEIEGLKADLKDEENNYGVVLKERNKYSERLKYEHNSSDKRR